MKKIMSILFLILIISIGCSEGEQVIDVHYIVSGVGNGTVDIEYMNWIAEKNYHEIRYLYDFTLPFIKTVQKEKNNNTTYFVSVVNNTDDIVTIVVNNNFLDVPSGKKGALDLQGNSNITD